MHAHHFAVMQDFEDSVCHLKTMHRGSISNNQLSFATVVLVFCFILLIQSVLVSAKRAKLREIVGKIEEEEPEGEAVAGPSGEATIPSSGITPSLLSFSLLSIYAYTYIFFFSIHPCCTFHS